MDNLKTTSKIVKTILAEDQNARNNDGYLYIKVLELCGKRDGVDYVSMAIRDLMPFVNSLGIPNSETVRRTRQKLQADYPELAANASVKAMRAEKEKEFLNYARS